jgi:hypothetical protein
MVSKITAITAYCPRIQPYSTTVRYYRNILVQNSTLTDQLVTYVHETKMVALRNLLLEGQSVHTGTAIYVPTMGLNGKFNVKVRVDARLLRAINEPGAFHGTLLNADNIGRSCDELIAMWNADHPDGPA